MRPRGTTTLYMISKGNTKRGRRERCDFNRHWNVAYRIVVRRISWGENDIEDVISWRAGEHVAHVGCCGARWLYMFQGFARFPPTRVFKISRRGDTACSSQPLALDKALVVQPLQHRSAQLTPVAEHRLLPPLKNSELYGI